MRTILSFAIFLAAALPLQAGITVSFGKRSVTAEGLTPGGGAVFFAVGHEPHDFYYTTRRVSKLVADDDRDGKVSYTATADIPWKSVWFVVDVQTGRYAIGQPEEFPVRAPEYRRSRPVKDPDGLWSRLEHERGAVELLLIRPGGDVWKASAVRGGATDLEKKGGPRYQTAVGAFEPLTPRARPLTHLNAGDVVIAIDPSLVQYFLMGVE